MSYQPVLISNYETGLENDLKPWLLPNDGFPTLEDCYIFRGRVVRKNGVRKIGRLQLYNPIGGTVLGEHTTKPQTFGPQTFPSVPVALNSVFITDGTTTYQDDGLGDLIASAPNQAITGITNASSAVISFAGSPLFSMGDKVWVTGTIGLVGINGIPLTITAVGATSITVNYDSTLDQPWVEGGVANWYGGAINYATGVYTVTFYSASTSTNVISNGGFFPNNPVMGLTQLQTPSINQEQLIAFDTTNAYLFNNSTLQFTDISYSNLNDSTTSFTWTGNNSQFFWSLNYANAIFTSNFNAGDGIYYFALAAGGYEGWQKFAPTLNAGGSTLGTGLMIFSYRGRLVFINTIEGGVSYPQRARWCQDGTPYYQTGMQNTPPAPFGYDVNAWREDVQGKGGYSDAPTREMALSGAFIDDNLIVYFEKSTWLLRYTNDPNAPFVWEGVNSDFGSESTFSSVTFDKGIFTIGNAGVITCDGNNVLRIDQKIPDEVFNIQNINQGPQRVQGIRNFKRQLVYWTFSNDVGGIFPNRVLVLNYVESSYSFFNDSFTCFGFYEPSPSIQWRNLNSTWQGWNYSWNNPLGQSYDLQLAAGNQQGFVLQIDAQDYPDPSLEVDAITTSGSTTLTTIQSNNHNLKAGQFIALVSLFGTGNLTQFTSQILKVETVVDANNFIITNAKNNQFDSSYTYTAGGEIIVLNNFNVLTKRFNLGVKEGRQTAIGYTDFYINRDDTGQFQCDIYVDADDSQPCYSLTVSAAAEPLSSLNTQQIWKRVYGRFIGQFFQYNFYLSDAQMYSQYNTITNFELHAMIMWINKAGRLPY